jgi:alpha-glucosidase
MSTRIDRGARSRVPTPANSQCDHPWSSFGVVYQVYPKSFLDTNGDGVGDLSGVTQKLDYIKSLGVDAIWLTPFFTSPQVDNGYDVSNYTDVDPQYGTLEDAKRLVSETHKRGLKVIFDIAVNHTSDQHPFFVDAVTNKESPYRDFYIFAPPNPATGGPPSNWQGKFTPSMWKSVPELGLYYLHSFAPEQPDLNWENPKVRAFVVDAMKFWADVGADGFRLDAVNFLGKDRRFPDNPFKDEFRPGSSTEKAQIRKHNLDLPVVHEYVRELRADVEAQFPYVALISEASTSVAEVMKYHGDGTDEVHLPFNFILVDAKKLDATDIRRRVNEVYDASAGRAVSWVLSNHDNTRAVTRLGDARFPQESAKLLGALRLTLPGAPFVYQGEEIGLPSTPPKSLDEARDTLVKHYGLARAERDGARTPMQWNNSEFFGFSATTPWILPTGLDANVNVAAQEADPSSSLHFHRRLTKLRRLTPALCHGQYQALGDHKRVFAYERFDGRERVQVFLNMSAEPTAVDLPAPASMLLSSAQRESLETNAVLAPYEALIVRVG